MGRRRVALVGIDGFSPLWMERFLRQGHLPRLGRIVSEGVSVPLRSTLPATTPVAWATVATGCSPALTGIDANLIHRPGDPLDRRLGPYAHRCAAEPLWETVSRAGKRSMVVKFPVSYPSSTAGFRLDGAAGWAGLKCLHEAGSAGAADTVDSPGTRRLHTSTTAWRGEHEAPGETLWRGRWSIPSLWGKEPVALHVLVTRRPEGPLRITVSSAPDWGRRLGELAPGAWSDPLTVRAEGRRGVTDVSFRIKVLECDGDPLRLRLYNTVLHERTGHSDPPGVWRRHLEAVGPIEEQTDPFLLFEGAIDLETQLEIFRTNADWLQRVSTSLLTGEEWDLFMVQLHFTDWAHHMLEGGLDPRHPDYRPEKAASFENALERTYRLADRVVGAIQDVLEPGDDLVVLGDHGQDLHHTTLRVNEWLANEGLLTWQGDGAAVAWEGTRAFAAGNFVYWNLEHREPTGIVASHEVEQLTSTVVEGLLSLVDPGPGVRPILLAGPKDHFEALGAHGAGAGDVIFVCRSGYQSRNDRGDLFTQTRLLREFTSGHDHFWPLDPRLQTRLFAVGPDFARGYRHRRSETLTDIAPTLCRLLDIEPAAQCEGRPIESVLLPGLERPPRASVALFGNPVSPAEAEPGLPSAGSPLDNDSRR